ncbi:MAG: hypothetical protein LBH94_02745, partial [Deltaproteobacteria bacterium]|nr:hypothetical protein [Deltaproteobacteria bacterium]
MKDLTQQDILFTGLPCSGKSALPEAHVAVPQTPHEGPTVASRNAARLRTECAALQRRIDALEEEREQLLDTLGEHNLEAFKHHALAARAFGFALRRVGRIAHRIPGLALFSRACAKFLRMVLNARYNRQLFFHELAFVREMTEDWPTAAHFLPPRPLSPQALAGKPNLLFLCTTLGAGGAERQLANLAIRLHQAGHRV